MTALNWLLDHSSPIFIIIIVISGRRKRSICLSSVVFEKQFFSVSFLPHNSAFFLQASVQLKTLWCWGLSSGHAHPACLLFSLVRSLRGSTLVALANRLLMGSPYQFTECVQTRLSITLGSCWDPKYMEYRACWILYPSRRSHSRWLTHLLGDLAIKV